MHYKAFDSRGKLYKINGQTEDAARDISRAQEIAKKLITIAYNKVRKPSVS